MPHSHALFTAEDAPRSDGVRTVGSAESVMPNGLTDADDADDAKNHGGAFYSATVHKSVTILEPMSKSHMASEGDPQVALAASQASTCGPRGDSPPYPTSLPNRSVVHLDSVVGRNDGEEPEPKRAARNSHWEESSRSAAEKANAESKWDKVPPPKKKIFLMRGAEAKKTADPSLSNPAEPTLQDIHNIFSSNSNNIAGSGLAALLNMFPGETSKYLDQDLGLNSNLRSVDLSDQSNKSPPFQKVLEKDYSPGPTKGTKKKYVSLGIASGDSESSSDESFSPTALIHDNPTDSLEGSLANLPPQQLFDEFTESLGMDSNPVVIADEVEGQDKGEIEDEIEGQIEGQVEALGVERQAKLQQLLDEALLQLKSEEEGERAPMYDVNQGMVKLTPAQLQGLSKLHENAELQKKDFVNLENYLKIRTQGLPTEQEKFAALCCFIATSVNKPILGEDLKPDSPLTRSLARLYLTLVPSVYAIQEKLIAYEDANQGIVEFIDACFQLVAEEESLFAFNTGHAVPIQAGELRHYIEAGMRISGVIAPQMVRVRKAFLDAYEELLHTINNHSTALTHLFATDTEAAKVFLLFDQWQRVVNNEAGTIALTGQSALGDHIAGSVYPPFLHHIAQVLGLLQQAVPRVEATRCWLADMACTPSDGSVCFPLENWFLSQLVVCPALDTEQRAKVAQLLQHRKLNADCFPYIKPYDMVQEAFAEPVRSSPLFVCSTRLSSQLPPRVWTPEEARQAHLFQEYMRTKRENHCRGLVSDMQVPARDGSSIGMLPRHEMSVTNSEPTTCRRPSSMVAACEAPEQLPLANSGDPRPGSFATHATARPSMPMAEYGETRQPLRSGDMLPVFKSEFNELKALPREIEAWGGDPPTLVVVPRDKAAIEVLQFVPILTPQRQSSLPASTPELADQQREATRRLRPQTPPPARCDSPSSYWCDAAFDMVTSATITHDAEAALPMTITHDADAATSATITHDVEAALPKTNTRDMEATLLMTITHDADAATPDGALATSPPDSRTTHESPPSTQATADADAPADGETQCLALEPLATPTAPPLTPTPQHAPPAPTQLSRETTGGASRRRRLDLISHKEIQSAADDDNAWGADPPEARSKNRTGRSGLEADTPSKSKANQPSSVRAVDISQHVLREQSTGSPPRYVRLATNNLDLLLSDEAGARCYHCLGEPTICPDTPVVDNSTTLCPLCGVDAVVPASEVIEEENLHAWRYLAFYAAPDVGVSKQEQAQAASYSPEAAPTLKDRKVLTQTEPSQRGHPTPSGGFFRSGRPHADELEWSRDHAGAAEQLRREIEMEMREQGHAEMLEPSDTSSPPPSPSATEAPSTLGRSKAEKVGDHHDDKTPDRQTTPCTYDVVASAYDKAIECLRHSKSGESCKPAVRQLGQLLQTDFLRPETLQNIEDVLRAHLKPNVSGKYRLGDAEARGPRSWEKRLEVLRPRTVLLTTTDGDLEQLGERDEAVPGRTDPDEPARTLSESDILSTTQPETSLPAAYLDTRPLSVAFRGDANGATVVFVSGATAPIEQGGQGLQANQDITIDASRVQTHPKLVSLMKTRTQTPDPKTQAHPPRGSMTSSNLTKGKGSLKNLAGALVSTPSLQRRKEKGGHRSGMYGFPHKGGWGEPDLKVRTPGPSALSPPPPVPCDPVLNQWFTGRATLLNEYEGSICEKDEGKGPRFVFETHPCHEFDYSGNTTAGYWVAFRKDPTNHPGRALSVVRINLPEYRSPGWDRFKTTPAHRPPPAYKGRWKLPLVSIMDSLPTTQELFRRYYGPVKEEVEGSMFYRIQYTDFPLTLESADIPIELTNLHRYGRIYQSGLSYPYEGRAASVRTKGGGGELFKSKYCTLLEYMLGHAPKALYTQINLRGIYFVNDLKYYGKPAKTLVVPSTGIILIDLEELLHSLSVTTDLAKTLTYKVSRVLHELGHLCDYASDPEGWQKPDPGLGSLLPDHRFPSASDPSLVISYATRGRLPNSMLYAATSPEEFRAEALADVWMSEGYPFGLAAASLHYWNARARTKVPALCRMIDGGFPAPFRLPVWGRDALHQYRSGDHREITPLCRGLRELAHGQHVAKSRQEATGTKPPSNAAYAGDVDEPPLWHLRADKQPNVAVVDLADLPEKYPLHTPGRFNEPPSNTLSITPPSSEAADEATSVHEEGGAADDSPSQLSLPRMTGASNRLARREPHLPKGQRGGKAMADKVTHQPGWVTSQNTWDHDHGRGHGSQRVMVAAAMKNRNPHGPRVHFQTTDRGQSRAEREGCVKSKKHARSPASLRSRRATAESSFLQQLEMQCARSHTPPSGLCEVTVFFDVRGDPFAQRHKINLDLDEQAALLLYRIVLQIVGHVSPNMLGWRLLGGPNQISFDTMDSGRGIGLCSGNYYALVGRMKGGSDQPHQPDDPEPPIGNPEGHRQREGVITRGQSHMSDAAQGIHQLRIAPDVEESDGQVASNPVEPPSAAPAATPNPGPESSSQRDQMTDQRENPVDVSPPYRPLGDGTEGNARGKAPVQGGPEATPTPPPPFHHQKDEILTFTPDPEAALKEWAATMPAPPTTPHGEAESSSSKGAIFVESRGPFRFTPRENVGNPHSEAPVALRRQEAHDKEAETIRRQAQDLEDRIEAEVQARTDTELQRRLMAATAAALDGIEEETPQNTRDAAASEAAASRLVTQAREVGAIRSRSVNFDSVEPASLPHRPRSERPAGTESRWQHFQHGAADVRWGDEPEMPSRQSSDRSQSPPSPTPRDHTPNVPTPSGPIMSRHSSSALIRAPTYTSSAQAAHRGATGSTFTQPNDADADAQQNTLSYWEAEESTTFTDAPSTSIMERYFERHQVDQAVIELVKRVRRQPWQANCASPHTNCFNPNLERPPIRQDRIFNSFKKLSDTRVSQKDFKFFHDPRLTAPTEHEQLHAWIKVRAEMCITLRQCVDTRCAGSEFLPAIRDELNRMLGHTQALPQLAALIVQGLQTFVTLASNCLLLACDNHFCPEYSPLTALQTVQRKSGQALVDLFANIELLMLQSKHQEQQGRDYLYTTLCNTDRQVIPDLHRYAVHAIESGDQPWAAEVALAFDRACTNARAYARTVNERDRPNVLQLQTIAFTAGVIGLDQNLSLGYRNEGRPVPIALEQEDQLHTQRQTRVRGPRVRSMVAPVTTRSAGPTQRPPPLPQQPTPAPPLAPMQPPPPPPPPQQMQHLQPLDHTDRQGSAKPTEPRRGSATQNPITTTNLWIDMMEVRRASEESDPTRRRLATMIWPSDDCTRFASDIECKPTPVFENDGKPAYFNDGRPMVTFNHKKACRYCSVWAAQPANREEWKLWPQEVRDGQHNPKVCPRTIATLLKAGNPGASFLKERWGKNKATRPEGGQRRAGQ